jgi:hypothetical protein
MIMPRYLLVGFICIILLCSLQGICSAEESESVLGYIQGESSTIKEGINGTNIIEIHKIVPYFYFSEANRSNMRPVFILKNATCLMNAVLVGSDLSHESISMIQILNFSVSEDSQNLTLTVRPLEFYEGGVLQSFEEEGKKIDISEMKENQYTDVYLELIRPTPTNTDDYKLCGCTNKGYLKCHDDVKNEWVEMPGACMFYHLRLGW